MTKGTTTTDLYWLGLTLTEAVAVYTGIFGAVTGLAALIIAWRAHAYTKSKDKIKFSAKVEFANWEFQTGAYGTGEPELETRYGFSITLFNRGPEFRINDIHIHNRILPLLRWSSSTTTNVYGIDFNRDSEVIESGDTHALRATTDETSSFTLFARLKVHTRSDETVYVKMQDWRKALSDFRKWKSDHPAF